jgi:Tfp pilus assembly protein PilN
MRAVNLIPSESRRGGAGDLRSLRGPGTAVVGLLVVVLALVTLYVLASNNVTQRRTELANLQQKLSQTQAEATKLAAYTQFNQLAKARVDTVRQIAAARFNWQQALADLSRVVPANTTLSSVSATVNPGVAAGGGAAASTGGLRGDITSPAFELQGCTANQDDVARVMSRLRLIRGVIRVTLADSVKQGSASPSTPVTSSSAGPGSPCAADGPSFDVVVFFEPLPTLAAPTTVPGSGTTGPTGAVGIAGSAQ